MINTIRRAGPLVLLAAAMIALGFAVAGYLAVAAPKPGPVPVLKSPPSPTIAALVPPSISKRPVAFASAYVHAENCRDALVGGNGDNDLQNFRVAAGQTGYNFEAGQSRFSGTRVAIPVWWSGNSGSRYPYGYGGFGYCMGDDSNIVDHAPSPPSGW